MEECKLSSKIKRKLATPPLKQKFAPEISLLGGHVILDFLTKTWRVKLIANDLGCGFNRYRAFLWL